MPQEGQYTGGGGKGVQGRGAYLPKKLKGAEPPELDTSVLAPKYEPSDYGQPKPPPDLSPTLADRIMVSSERTKAIFRTQGTDANLYHVPDTMFWTAAVRNDATTSQVVSEVLGFFTQVYGSEDLAAFMSAHLLDPKRRDATIATLKYLRGYTPSGTAALSMRAGMATPVGDPSELVGQYLADPSIAESWTPDQHRAVAGIADELLGTIEEMPDIGASGDLKRATAVGISGDVRMALTEREVNQLTTFVESYNLGNPGSIQGLASAIQMDPQGNVTVKDITQIPGGKTVEASELGHSLGIDQVRQLAGGVIVLDKDYAQSDPAKAYAIQQWLEQNYPDMEVQVGKEGAVGAIVSATSIGLDYLSAPFGAGIRQISELAERVTSSEGDRKTATYVADRIEELVKEGNRTKYDTFINTLGPYADIVPGLDETGSPDRLELGGALADIAKETGLNVETDASDTTWMDDALRGAAHLREAASDDVGWQQFNDDMIANTAPRVVGTGWAESVMTAADSLPGDPMYGVGFATAAIQGAFMFDPLFVWGPGILGGLKAAQVIPKMHIAEYAGVLKKQAEMLRMADETLSYDRAFEIASRAMKGQLTADAWYPIVGAGYVKNAIYRSAALFPEQLFENPLARKAGEGLHELTKAIGPEEMFSVLKRFYGKHMNVGGGTETARLISGATSAEDAQLSMFRAEAGMGQLHVPMTDLTDELTDVVRRISADDAEIARRAAQGEAGRAAEAARVEAGATPLVDQIGRGYQPMPEHPELLSLADKQVLIERAQHIKDVLYGREFIRPMRQILTSKQMRQLRRVADQPANMFEKVLDLSIDAAENFPQGFYGAIDHIYKSSGGGEVIALPHTTLYAKTMYGPDGQIIENLVEDGFNHLSDIGHTLGLSDKRVNQILGGWGDLSTKTPSEGYDFLIHSWETMVDEAKNLPQFAKDDLKKMWREPSTDADRTPGWITLGPNHFEATLKDAVTGKPFPGFEADMLTVWRTPGVAELRSYLSNTQRTMKLWSTGNGLKKGIAGLHTSVANGWAAFNNLWRTSVLGFRLFGALPARIFNEQMLRIAGYDYASLVHHPWEWLSSTHYGARNMVDAGYSAMFLEHPGSALGVMTENVTRQPTFMQIAQGRSTVALGEAGYAEAAAIRLGRMHVSYSTNAWLLRNLDDTRAVPRAELLDELAQSGEFVPLRERALTGTDDLEALKASIADVGQVEPIEVSRSGGALYLEDGAHRLQALEELGIDTVLVKTKGVGPEAAVEVMKNSEQGRAMLKLYEQHGVDAVDAVRSLQTEIRQLIGTGPGAEKVRSLLRIGVMEDGGVGVSKVSMKGGKVARHGTANLAEELQRMYDAGEWVPDAKYLNPSMSYYLPAQRAVGIKGGVDNLFRWMYSNPDLALSRGPLYRQMAGREYGNLIGKGYSPAAAKRAAHAYAARGTADLMFTIGAKTSGEWFLKNINPFFPAWRELATTWIKRIPLRVGEGHWALGATTLTRRATVWYEFFKGIGVVREDADGKPFVPMPFFAPVIRAFTGTDAQYEVGAPISSLAGIFPFPSDLFDETLPWSDRLSGAGPGFGGPAALLLALVNKTPGFRGGLDSIDDWFTLTGADASLGPASVDRMLEAFGIEAPWMSSTTQDFHESMQSWSIIDGLRISYPEMVEKNGEPPNQVTDPGAYNRWAEDWMAEGRRFATGMYIFKAVSGMTLPFSLQVQDEDKAQMAAMWALIDALPKDPDGNIQNAVIRATLEEYPEVEPWMTGKNIDTRTTEHLDEDRDTYMEAVKAGQVIARTPEEWAAFHLFQHSKNEMYRQIDALFAGKTPAELMVDFDTQNTRRRLLDEFDYFKEMTRVNLGPGMTQSVADMDDVYERYKEIRAGEGKPHLTFEQYRIMQVADVEDEISKYFSPNPETSEKYYKLKDQIYELLDYEATTPFGLAQQWYFGEVQDGYYGKLDKLYDRASQLDDAKAGVVYDKIRRLANENDHTFINPQHPEWGEFPSPEEYSFLKLEPKEQQRQVTEWADRPATWLTGFQREQVYASVLPADKKDEANELSDYVEFWNRRLRKTAEREGISSSSTAYEESETKLQGFYTKKANDLGVGEYWRAANTDLPYLKVGPALDLASQTSTWTAAVKKADELNAFTEKEGFKPGGGGEVDLAQQKKMIERVTAWRRTDQAFDTLMSQMQVWLGEEGQPLSSDEVVEKLFFGAWI